MKRPLVWAIVAANLAALLALAFIYPGAMVSPGALVPAHAALAGDCFACHVPFRGAASGRCVGCHALADIGVRSASGAPAERRTRGAIGASFHQELTEPSCISCHSEHGRLTERLFSHALLRPAVRGDCVTCHEAPANGLHRDLRVGCNQCHSTERWAPATFNHALLPAATLARCEGCHTAPKDSVHQGTTGACAPCHSPQSWKPSTLDHRRFFVLDRDHDTSCTTCHVDSDFTRYTCFGCHEHTPEKIRAEHEEEGITRVDNCVSCHRSADAEGGERGGGRERGKGRDDGEH